ncbi:MAG: hypothetical protein JWR05_1009 [Mucilaginibacter sp.]|nr:hypothetical protein [Mucilaginibacter sp.]
MKSTTAKTALLLFIICAYITFLFAAQGYPLFVVDSGCFLPTSYFINHAHQLINPFYDAGIDPINHKFIFYPPLFPYVVSSITKILPTQITNIPIALTIIDNITIALILISIYYYAKKKEIQYNWITHLFVFVLVISIYSFQGISSGRPEILSRMLIAGFLLNNLACQKNVKHLINGLLLGLALITSPISAIYLILINGAILTYKDLLKFIPIIITLLGFSFVLGCFSLLYPYHLNELFEGMRTHSANVVFNRVGSDYMQTFLTRHIVRNDTPLSFLPFAIVILYVFRYLIRQKFYFTTFLIFILALIICYFTFKDFQMSYNLYVLSPFVSFLMAVIFIRTIKSQSSHSGLVRLAVILVLFMNSLGFIRKTVVFFKVRNDLVSPASFRADLLKTIKQTGTSKKVVVSNGLWPYALDQQKKVILYRTGDMNYLYRDSSVKFLLIQQSNSGQLKPADHPGFKLIKNEFAVNNIRLWKILLGNTYPGYQIAIYERK